MTLAPVATTPLTIPVDAEPEATPDTTSAESNYFYNRFGKKGTLFGIGIVTVGVLTAAILPAYLSYAARASLEGALPLINDTRQKITQVIQQKNFLPSENVLANLPENISNKFVSSIQLKDGAQMVVAFRIALLGDSKTIIWTPTKNGEDVVWSCLGGTLSDEYRMPECRGGSRAK
jgi:Tfp pilus assembly protein PilE